MTEAEAVPPAVGPESVRPPEIEGYETVVMDTSGRLDVGQERDHNEDRLAVMEWHGARFRGLDGVYVVADGMGGHAAGEVAAASVVDVVRKQVIMRDFPRSVSDFGDLSEYEQKQWLTEVVNQANSAVFQARKRQGSDMGATLVMAVRRGDEVAIANAGDSRAYIASADGRKLTQVTTDHSLVERLVATGQITRDEARTHPQRNVIYRVMGDKPRLEPDVFRAKIPRGGAMLLCSDGLFGMVEDERILEIIRSSGSAEEATRQLVEAANAAGGEDNISVIVVRNEPEESEAQAVELSEGRRRRRVSVLTGELQGMLDQERPDARVMRAHILELMDHTAALGTTEQSARHVATLLKLTHKFGVRLSG